MTPRRPLLALPFLLAACGLSERPFEERRQWPLLVPRPTALPSPRGGRTLELRALREGPGLAPRGLQTLQDDGSLKLAFYEEWTVPPAQGVEDALRAWLAASGRFAAVVPPGSRIQPDYILEGEVTALLAIPRQGIARAAISLVLLEAGTPPRAILQRRLTAEARLPGPRTEDAVAAQLAALADIFQQVENLLPK